MSAQASESGDRMTFFELAVQDARGLAVAADVRPDRMEAAPRCRPAV